MRDDAERDPFAARTARMNGDGGPALWVDDAAWDETALPRRAWIAPGFALRGSVTIVAGPPSAMKSSLMLAWGCAVALGRPHGRFRPAEPDSVIIYNVEDDITEQRRRLSAVLRQFDAVPSDIASKLIRTGPTGVGMLFERDADTGDLFPTAALLRLRALLAEHSPAALIADPFAELHDAEENDNTAIRRVIAEFRAIAVEFNIAVILVHHTRKGAVTPGDPDAARGASAIVGAGRVVLTVTTMSEDDAAAFGLPAERNSRFRYIRVDDAKQNYAPLDEAKWYEAMSYMLDNGETVAAAVPWNPPDFWQAISGSLANAILDRIDAGIEGRRFSPAPHSKDRAAWPLVRDMAPSLNEAQAKTVIATWRRNGVLEVRKYDDPKERRQQDGLFLVTAKRPRRKMIA